MIYLLNGVVLYNAIAHDRFTINVYTSNHSPEFIFLVKKLYIRIRVKTVL